ncbi:polysaccharide pyruvyl transferase family protein [Bacteroides graminisolvens]|uniref:polysaccharide pyruvyl transferase family protein n=1 Tax=Bacteroides graminisolvens TaxID=477666 RepID=UPI0023F0AD47|nr:polysaccharide pyruvyl transferase family protein [Bacteroides graminisolvens]
MKIGLLAYHAACNFGAFLQLLSTVEYIKKQGDEPRVINWIPRDFRKDYEKRALPEVRALYEKLQQRYYALTELCETAQEVASVIEKEQIEAVIIGSDAVCQHHPFRERFHFPVKRIIYIAHPTSDRMYPNCFWGEFNKYLKAPVPLAMISGSSQDSQYYYITGRTKLKMKESIKAFSYLSVRDEWSQKMISYLTDNEIKPDVTPDPVFAFNFNAGHLVPTKEEIAKRFNIPKDYVLISFKTTRNTSVTQEWIDGFQTIANKNGLSCVKLPYADTPAFGNVQYSVEDEITPLEWYALIKYSNGYVGNNMHPIVTSISNGVPFYSFDNYGVAVKDGKPTNGESSKIYHLLSMSGFLANRDFTKEINYVASSPLDVLNAILEFDCVKETDFAKKYYLSYLNMMQEVYASISK